MMRLRTNEWPSAGLLLREDAGGLLVTQQGISYRVRKLHLSEQLVALVDASVDHGIDCVVRTKGAGHPLRDKWNGGAKFDRGSHSLPFSRRPDERWIFAVEKSFTHYREVFCEKAWRHVIQRLEIPWQWEIAGGKNILLKYEWFLVFLDHLDDALIEEIESSRHQRFNSSRIQATGITSEAQLQNLLVDVSSGLLSEDLRRVFVEFRNEAGRADLLLETKSGKACVLELKRGRAGSPALQQVLGYMDSMEVRGVVRSGHPYGAVVAAGFEPSLLRDALNTQRDVGFYEYRIDQTLRLHHVAGPRVLDGPLGHGLASH